MNWDEILNLFSNIQSNEGTSPLMYPAMTQENVNQPVESSAGQMVPSIDKREMLKQKLMSKIATPAPQPASEVAMDTPDKVNPWAVFASGVGQTLQGRPVDNSWAENKNKLEYDKALKKFTLAKQEQQQKIDNSFREKQLAETIAARREIAAMTHGQKAQEKASKDVQTLKEVENRRQDIQQNILDLQKMVKDKGTFETFGSHNQDLDRKVDQVATDMAKLMDPNSVARPNEVELVKKNLIQSGFQNTNATAYDILENFKKEVENRTNTAYKVRGLEAPQSSSQFPKQIRKGNQTATVSNEQELAEAQSEGWQ